VERENRASSRSARCRWPRAETGIEDHRGGIKDQQAIKHWGKKRVKWGVLWVDQLSGRGGGTGHEGESMTKGLTGEEVEAGTSEIAGPEKKVETHLGEIRRANQHTYEEGGERMNEGRESAGRNKSLAQCVRNSRWIGGGSRKGSLQGWPSA